VPLRTNLLLRVLVTYEEGKDLSWFRMELSTGRTGRVLTFEFLVEYAMRQPMYVQRNIKEQLLR
jgi:hypothetical protein